MSLVCHSAQGVTAHKPRRCAAAVSFFLGRIFQGSIFFSALGVAAVGKDLMVDNKSSGFIIGVECIIIGCRVRCFASLNCAEIHRRRRYWWRFRRLRGLWAEEESVRTYRTKKVRGRLSWASSLWVGQRMLPGNPVIFCRICRKDVSVMTHGVHEILCLYQGTKHFPRHQRLRLETPVWRVVDFEGNPMRKKEVERQRERILRATSSEGYRISHFRRHDLAQFGFSRRESSRACQGFCFDWSIAFGRELRTGPSGVISFHSDHGQVKADVTWSRDEALVGAFLLLCYT